MLRWPVIAALQYENLNLQAFDSHRGKISTARSKLLQIAVETRTISGSTSPKDVTIILLLMICLLTSSFGGELQNSEALLSRLFRYILFLHKKWEKCFVFHHQHQVYNDRQRLRSQLLGGLTATQAWISILRSHGRDWLRDINTQVSYIAVDLMAHQARLAIAAYLTAKNPCPKHLSVCTGSFTQQFALPCAHRILERLEAYKSIQKDDIHPRWWLEKPLVRKLSIYI